jgi:chromosome segregation ATPase
MILPSGEAVLTFLSGVVIAAIAALSIRSKTVAEASKASSEAEASLSRATLEWAQALKADLKERISELRAEYDEKLEKLQTRLTELDAENRLYRRYNGMLIGQIKEAGMIPVPPPILPECE